MVVKAFREFRSAANGAETARKRSIRGPDSAPGWTSLPSPLKNSLNVRNRRSIFPSRMVPRLRARSERVGQAKGEALRVRFPDHGAVFDRAAQERHLPLAEQFPLLREAVVDGEATYGAKPEPGA